MAPTPTVPRAKIIYPVSRKVSMEGCRVTSVFLQGPFTSSSSFQSLCRVVVEEEAEEQFWLVYPHEGTHLTDERPKTPCVRGGLSAAKSAAHQR